MPGCPILRLLLFGRAGVWLCTLGATLGVLTASGAFQRPSDNERARALGNRFEESEPLRTLLRVDADFTPIARPEPGDWLDQHEEPGQTFDDYHGGEPMRPDETRRIIYLLPLGEVAGGKVPLEDVRDYAAAFFQMEVRVLPPYVPREDEFSPRDRRTGKQWLTPEILRFLQRRLPLDAFCLLAVTTTDLYPAATWNYVFGQASLRERVGVYSFARYDPAFWGEPSSRASESLLLRRGCKVLVHETGHIFGLYHCIHYECVMNGSNHLAETDARPQHLCPVCLRKLAFATGFDPVRRYEQLHEFQEKHGWNDEAAWTRRQLEKVAHPPGRPPGR